MRRLVLLSLLLAAPLAALAQDREPWARQALVDLAYALGESHALRQVCEGPYDEYWRKRMNRMLEAEAADQALDTRLRQSFNAGFTAAQSRHVACTPESRKAEADVAAKGRDLSQRLASAGQVPEPSSRNP